MKAFLHLSICIFGRHHLFSFAIGIRPRFRQPFAGSGISSIRIELQRSVFERLFHLGRYSFFLIARHVWYLFKNGAAYSDRVFLSIVIYLVFRGHQDKLPFSGDSRLRYWGLSMSTAGKDQQRAKCNSYLHFFILNWYNICS